jgi:hypothetical protein
MFGIISIVILVAFAADIILTLVLPKFYASIGIPLKWLTMPAGNLADMTALKTKLAAQFEVYAFRGDDEGVWYRNKYRFFSWRRFTTFAATKVIITREGGDLRCRHVLGLSEILLLLLIASVMITDASFAYGWIVIGVVALATFGMAFFKNREFKQVLEAVREATGVPAPAGNV